MRCKVLPNIVFACLLLHMLQLFGTNLTKNLRYSNDTSCKLINNIQVPAPELHSSKKKYIIHLVNT